MESGENGLMYGTCFDESRLEVVAVVGLPCISWRVSGAAGLRVFYSVRSFFCSSNGHDLLQL